MIVERRSIHFRYDQRHLWVHAPRAAFVNHGCATLDGPWDKLCRGLIWRAGDAEIDVVKDRLIKKYGYNEDSATDVLNYVASIFARGDVKDRQ